MLAFIIDITYIFSQEVTDMTIEQLIQDLHALEIELQKFEKKYNLLSPFFYQLYKAGKLECDRDYLKWAGLYQIKLRRYRKYKDMLPEALDLLELENPVKADFFEPAEFEV